MPWAAAASAVASIGGSLLSSKASKGAADTQSASAKYAADLQNKQFQQTQANFAPFLQFGTNALNQFTPDAVNLYSDPGQGPWTSSNTLTAAAGSIPGVPTSAALPDQAGVTQAAQAVSAAAPGSMNEAELVKTPGYQFALSQGLQAAQNSAAARGLGVSGAALKGAATFATGLADNTYQNQFRIAQQQFQNAQTQFGNAQTGFGNQQQIFGDTNTNNQLKFQNQQAQMNDYFNVNTASQGNIQNAFNRLSGLTGIGSNAAAATGSFGQQAAAAQGNYLTQGANAQAAGQIAGANALTSGINGVSNAAQQYINYNRLYGDAGPGANGSYVGPGGYTTAPLTGASGPGATPYGGGYNP